MDTDIEKSHGCLRLVLIDDLPLRRASIKSLLDDWAREDHLRLEAIEPESIGDKLTDTDVQLIVFNIGGASMGTPEMRERVDTARHFLPSVPLVIISDSDDVGEVIEVLKAGASGFICAQISPSVVFQALRFIMGGGVYFPANALLQAKDMARGEDWRKSRAAKDSGYCASLTVRQNSVLRLLQKGYSNKHIARELSMCESTVKVHVRQIMRKLGASNRTQAALCGIEHGEPTETTRRSPSSVVAEPGASTLGL
ncbi:response regulator transcription factor [Aquabacter sp. CN5-332]|uniref:response regulator transcription factor n=1 Tax=Aquabacter sp. CN5-332 TaxID=3156608 RepID=UPI0032B5F068